MSNTINILYNVLAIACLCLSLLIAVVLALVEMKTKRPEKLFIAKGQDDDEIELSKALENLE